MRLICPNCAAQYEIDDALIPDGGRDVQCSNCGHTWFADHGSADAGVADEAGATEEAAPGRPRRRELDESTKRILREEAEREAEQRRRAAAAPPEEQTELGLEPARKGLDDLPDRDVDAPPGGDDAPRDGATEDTRRDPEQARSAAVTAAASRGDLLPDIDQINSTLTATSKRQRRDADDADDDVAGPRQKRSGFGLGFGLVLAVTALVLLVYVMAPRIVEAVPALEPTLAAYVSAINDFRVTLDGWLIAASQWIVALTGG